MKAHNAKDKVKKAQNNNQLKDEGNRFNIFQELEDKEQEHNEGEEVTKDEKEK